AIIVTVIFYWFTVNEHLKNILIQIGLENINFNLATDPFYLLAISTTLSLSIVFLVLLKHKG
ncbi:MAG: hypothetical protein HXX81_04010, partial [Campylobacterales bacterium]|nr:hypothetical protein [Campylobacterales bacterium]